MDSKKDKIPEDQYNPRQYTNLYQGGRKYRNLRQQISGEYKNFMHKFTYIRIPVAIILILVILFMTGVISDLFASNGNYETADKLVLFPNWMENYYPEKKAYYEAGKQFQNGDFYDAYNALSNIENYSEADRLKNRCIVKIAENYIADEEYYQAYTYLCMIEAKNDLPEEEQQIYNSVLEQLIEHYKGSKEADIINTLNQIKEQQ